MTGVCKFLISDFVLVLFLQMLGHIVKWQCDYFFFVFQMIENHHQKKLLKLKFDHFWIIWRPFFNSVSRFLMYISSGSRQHSVIGLWAKFHINVFIICVVTKLNWTGDCRNIISHVRSLYILFVKFVNLNNSVSHNEISNNFSKCWNYEILMIFLKILFDKISNMIEIDFKNGTHIS